MYVRLYLSRGDTCVSPSSNLVWPSDLRLKKCENDTLGPMSPGCKRLSSFCFLVLRSDTPCKKPQCPDLAVLCGSSGKLLREPMWRKMPSRPPAASAIRAEVPDTHLSHLILGMACYAVIEKWNHILSTLLDQWYLYSVSREWKKKENKTFPQTSKALLVNIPKFFGSHRFA